LVVVVVEEEEEGEETVGWSVLAFWPAVTGRRTNIRGEGRKGGRKGDRCEGQ
jgi:hypothetical protein